MTSLTTKSVAELASLPCLELLSYFRTIADIEQRRSVTAAVYARLKATWQKDERWDGMARHLVEDVHPMFREGFAQLRAACSVPEQVPEPLSPNVVRMFQQINIGLHHHHTLEDRMWFPRFIRLHREMENEVHILEQDHRGLVALEARILERDSAALVEFYESLVDHLNREEMITVPFLMEGSGGL
ncbi:UNVERIFIED_CONTAM: hypothetical protein HDU68_002484 [Siphonaria sp. JEL0065]|nr:hypothetical protein HDU68_002484 [Siphonaria sp. JEL0065]